MVYESSPSLSELSSPRRSSSSTPTAAGQVAPSGYHYMPDGTLMSDAEHDRLYGVKSVVKLKKNNEDILARDIHTVEKEYEISLNKNTVNPLTYGDIKNIGKDPVIIDISTVFRMNCVVEEIPVPKVNRILGLSYSPKNLISSDYRMESNEDNTSTINIDYYENDDGEEVKYPSNYVKDMGATINFTTTGDIGASFDLVVKDITNTKWYNWETREFELGYNSKKGVVDYNLMQLIIPPSTTEVEYHVFFESIGGIDYSHDLPTEKKPWYICQLMKSTTTFQFDDRHDEFIPEATVSKTYHPGVVVNNSEDGTKTDITMTVRPKRGQIKMINEDEASLKLHPNEFVYFQEAPDRTSILTSNLTASVNSDYSIGTITGTTTVHRSSIRDFNFLVDPTNYFKIV